LLDVASLAGGGRKEKVKVSKGKQGVERQGGEVDETHFPL
jgi:hypothetical protein